CRHCTCVPMRQGHRPEHYTCGPPREGRTAALRYAPTRLDRNRRCARLFQDGHVSRPVPPAPHPAPSRSARLSSPPVPIVVPAGGSQRTPRVPSSLSRQSPRELHASLPPPFPPASLRCGGRREPFPRRLAARAC